MNRQTRYKKTGSFTSKAFAETGTILFTGHLPENYPALKLDLQCWSPLYELEQYIEEENIHEASLSAERWDICIYSHYGGNPPPLAKKLEKCFTNMGLLRAYP